MTDRATDELVSRAEEFVSAEISPHAESFDRRGELPRSTIEALRDSGLLASTVPESRGGHGLSMRDYGRLTEIVGRACSSVRSLFTVHDMVAEAVQRIGGPAREEWLPRLVSGEALGAFALTEPDAGSDAASIATIAVADGDGYRIEGRKQWITFAQIADVLLVIARLESPDGPIGGFVVPRQTEGVTVEPIEGMLGTRASMLASLRFDGCRVPASGRVGPASIPSGFVSTVALTLGRYSVAWGCVGIGEACLRASYDRAAHREQFGVPIERHQLIARRLTDITTDVQAARLMCEHAGDLLDARHRSAVEMTFRAKYFASRVAMRAADHAVQIHGAQGTHESSPVQRYYRDARMMEIIEGSTEIQQIVIARHTAATERRRRDG